jgi:hypothetical protein
MVRIAPASADRSAGEFCLVLDMFRCAVVFLMFAVENDANGYRSNFHTSGFPG